MQWFFGPIYACGSRVVFRLMFSDTRKVGSVFSTKGSIQKRKIFPVVKIWTPRQSLEYFWVCNTSLSQLLFDLWTKIKTNCQMVCVLEVKSGGDQEALLVRVEGFLFE